MRFRNVSLYVMTAICLLAVPLSLVWSQTRATETDLQNVYDQIEALKASGTDVPADLYQRYFDIEAQVYPAQPLDEGRPGGSLDEARGCPGTGLTLPAAGDSVIAAGETYTAVDSCRTCRGNGARDNTYWVDIVQPTRLIIKTCMTGGFDTYLCVYRNSCCDPDSNVIRNDNSTQCGTASLKSYINQCFLEPGRYYIVIDGYNIAANGHYRLAIINTGDATCREVPEIPCPLSYLQHQEPVEGVENVCGQANVVPNGCPAEYCGIIEPSTDVDVYQFTLTECKQVTLRVFANDTDGHSGFLHGLNSKIRVFSGTACDHLIYMNDNVGGQVEGEPWGNDSRVVTACLRAGIYWAEVTGVNNTIGSYEFTISCTPCGSSDPLSDINVSNEGNNKFCVSWESSGAPIYYIWRYQDSMWILAGTTNETMFCETLPPESEPFYWVFDDPCGRPPEEQ